MLSFKTEVLETMKKFIDENCKKDGFQHWNVSNKQREGLLSLKRRIKEEDLVAMSLTSPRR